jgi:formate hydrogenlyase subunit 3/multisubunit Na+/H+ antiporter MnhD subunit
MTDGLFRYDLLSAFVGGFAALFTILIVIYSLGYLRGRRGLGRYYTYVLLTFVVTVATLFADNLLLFVVLWGVLGLLLYLLIAQGRGERASLTAKKAFVIIGATDALMLLGFALLWRMTPGIEITELAMSTVRVGLTEWTGMIAFLCLAAAALAKAGAMPFHTWVPDTAEDAPIPVTAYLPASLDKLLGIYLLARLVLELFQMTPAMNLLLMAVGSFTIIAAVMMALVQHDLRRLLGYHAVSQVGYMVLGLGTGNPLGVAGGLFHMVNNAIYKSGLFLCAGNVEARAGTSDLERLGGLGPRMPLTFGSFLVAAIAISGLPPLNGFASKWLVYQGIIESGRGGGSLWVVWLLAAMFGTALTLASFAKLLHAVFLGQAHEAPDRVGESAEVGASMWLPPALLALLCVVFGVFALQVPLGLLIFPSLAEAVQMVGIWDPIPATLLLVGALVLGLLPYIWASFGKVRVVEPFIGGEILDRQEGMRVSGVRFYRTVQEIAPLKAIYRAAEAKWLDPYELGKRLFLGLSKLLGAAHNGLLPRYVTWCLAGMLALFLLLRG